MFEKLKKSVAIWLDKCFTSATKEDFFISMKNPHLLFPYTFHDIENKDSRLLQPVMHDTSLIVIQTANMHCIFSNILLNKYYHKYIVRPNKSSKDIQTDKKNYIFMLIEHCNNFKVYSNDSGFQALISMLIDIR
jgi:hypothetical protein